MDFNGKLEKLVGDTKKVANIIEDVEIAIEVYWHAQSTERITQFGKLAWLLCRAQIRNTAAVVADAILWS